MKEYQERICKAKPLTSPYLEEKQLHDSHRQHKRSSRKEGLSSESMHPPCGGPRIDELRHCLVPSSSRSTSRDPPPFNDVMSVQPTAKIDKTAKQRKTVVVRLPAKQELLHVSGTVTL